VRSRARAVLATACSIHFVHDGFSDILYVLLPLWATEFRLTFAQVGLIRTVYSGGMAAFQIPAGLLDVHGEDALTCAARELFEETGYRHTSLEFVGGIYTSAGFTDEYIHLFLARTEAEPVGTPETGIELLRKPFEEMVGAARAGRVRDAKTAVALLLAAARPPGT